MSFLGIDLIDNCIEKTKNFLFPINKILWLKLALVTILAGMSSGSSFNFNTGQNIPAEFTQWVLNNLQWILIGIGGLLILGVIFALIRSLFNFVLLDSVEKQQCLIKKSLSENTNLGISYFWLSLIINGIFLIAILGLLAPIIILGFKNISNPMVLLSNPYFWLAIPIAILLAMVSGVINGIIYNLVMPDMYLKRIKALQSWKNMYRLFLKQLKEVIVYWVFKFLLGIAAGILSVVVFLILLLLFGIVGLILFGLGALIGMLSPILIAPLLIIGILLGTILLLLFAYSVAVVLVPIPVFFTNYRLDFYKAVIKK